MIEEVRVRFAPSPTGYLHIGGLRTALYNYLFAKKHHGKFILRIEDTDQSRFIPGAIENLLKIFNWIGLKFDESPEIEGEYGPYIQSQRLNIYRQHAYDLLKADHAYRCFCSPERLDGMRKSQLNIRGNLKYDRFCLNLSENVIKMKIDQGIPFTIRLKIPDTQSTIVNDIIRGDVEFQNNILDDQVLLKSDGYPTYHLANVVDDHLMKITHVIRGEEWLSSLPKHIILYSYFGWDKPKFAHLPLLLNPDKTKLSKRQGDVAVEEYREKGYLKEGLLNFILLLGWNAGDDKEYYELDEMINKFSLERVSKSGAVFDLNKLNWLNAEHIKRKSDYEIMTILKEILSKSKYKDIIFKDEYLLKIVIKMKERITFIKDLVDNCSYFFEVPLEYDKEVIKKRWNNDSSGYLNRLITEFEKLENPAKEDYESTLRKTAEDLGIGAGKLIHMVRLAVSGVGNGPGLFDLLYTLGKEESISRMKKAIDEIR